MTAEFYLAYGSNMDPRRIRARLGSGLLDAQCEPTGVAVLPAYGVEFHKALGDGSAAADVVPRSDCSKTPPLEALVWRVSDAALERLDVFEGVGVGHYRREVWDVEMTNGKAVSCSVYCAQPGVIVSGLLPRRNYVDHMITGADFFLSPAYRQWLRLVPTKGDRHV